MRYYETIYIVDPNLENQVLESLKTEVGQQLEKTGSKLINHRVWGKKRLAYPINKQKYGTFVLMQFEEGDQVKMVEFMTLMKLNNSIIRHMTVTLDSKPEVHVEEVKKEESSKSNDTELKTDVSETKEEKNKKVEKENSTKEKEPLKVEKVVSKEVK
jgi:small subunit ribosomal protein S6|tara:strand:+ start:3390 stop:3860 length:471 start_codon:yes stop_codon:yes gene_type:complete